MCSGMLEELAARWGLDDAHPEVPATDVQKTSLVPHTYQHTTPTCPKPAPVRSKVLKIWSWGRPHHMSFQLSWISFMIAFFATFAAPPMMPVIR